MKMMYNRRRRSLLIGVLFFTWIGLFAYSMYENSYSGLFLKTSPAPKEVRIKNHMFVPATITIKVNESIKWTNKDFAPHTVTAKDGSFNSGMMFTGTSWTHQFTKAGTYSYYCRYHEHMLGTITVEAVTAEK